MLYPGVVSITTICKRRQWHCPGYQICIYTSQIICRSPDLYIPRLSRSHTLKIMPIDYAIAAAWAHSWERSWVARPVIEKGEVVSEKKNEYTALMTLGRLSTNPVYNICIVIKATCFQGHRPPGLKIFGPIVFCYLHANVIRAKKISWNPTPLMW